MLFINLLLGQFCESLTFAPAALVILYTRVCVCGSCTTGSVPNTIGHATSAHFNDHRLISSLAMRLGFRIGKVFANHADNAR